MSDRERWTVYPLILLCLAIALRDKLVPPTTLSVPDVRCQRIEIVDGTQEPRLVLGLSQDQAGLIEVLGKDGKPRLKLGAVSGKSGFVEVINAAGTPAIYLTIDEENAGVVSTFAEDTTKRVVLDAQGERGRISTFDHTGRPIYMISSDDQGNGFSLMTDKQGRIHIGLSALVRSNQNPAESGQESESRPEGEPQPGEDEASPPATDEQTSSEQPKTNEGSEPEVDASPPEPSASKADSPDETR